MASSTDAESSKLPSQGHTPTALGILISGAKNCEQDFILLENTTLNEKYGVMADQATGKFNGSQFKLGWFGVGIKGSKCVGENADGIEVRRILDHTATDFAPFKPIPLCMRELENDLTEEERKNYRIRCLEKIGDKTYVKYMAKPIGFDLYTPSIKLGYRDPVTGNSDEDEYTPKKTDLTPTPYELLSTDSVPISDKYVTATGTLNLTLEAKDLDEIRNACIILYGTASVAAISEICLIHGVETKNTGEIKGGTVKYDEICPACVSYQITELYGRDANTNNRLKLYFEYGNSISYLTEIKSTDSVTINE